MGSFYLANEKYNSTLSAGYTVGQNTLSVHSVPDNVPTIIVAAKGTDNETVFSVTGKTTNSLTGVTRLRGANVNLDATTPLTCLNNIEFVNQYQGAASTPESLKNLIYAQDGGSSDDYAISLDPAPAEYVAGMLVAFKANTANEGAATLNVNNLGAKAIKKNGEEALADNDIKAGQIVTVVYDGTSFQLVNATNTLTKPTLKGSVQAVTANDDAATITFDMAASNYHTVTLGGNRTLAVTNVSVGQSFIIRLKQDATGGRTVTWWEGISWAGGEAPSLTTDPNKADVFGFTCTSSGNYDGFVVGQSL
jgi:hypothetical protein